MMSWVPWEKMAICRDNSQHKLGSISQKFSWWNHKYELSYTENPTRESISFRNELGWQTLRWPTANFFVGFLVASWDSNESSISQLQKRVSGLPCFALSAVSLALTTHWFVEDKKKEKYRTSVKIFLFCPVLIWVFRLFVCLFARLLLHCAVAVRRLLLPCLLYTLLPTILMVHWNKFNLISNE